MFRQLIIHSSSTWQTYFAKEFDKREPDMTNPFYNQQESIQTTNDPSMLDFFQLSLETRVHLLYLLCEVSYAYVY